MRMEDKAVNAPDFSRSTLRSGIYQEIKDQILEGTIVGGARIRENLIAKKLGVSRTPVREAVAQLEREGFVRIVPRRGVFVTEVSPREMLDVLEVRIALEKLAVKKAAKHATEKQIKFLESLLEDQRRFAELKDYDACIKLDADFHRAIIKISGNTKLIDFMENIEDFVQMARIIDCEDRENVRRTIQEHKEILERIRTGQAEEAVEAMLRHLERIKVEGLAGRSDDPGEES